MEPNKKEKERCVNRNKVEIPVPRYNHTIDFRKIGYRIGPNKVRNEVKNEMK
jgi:hypothetical protein